MTSDAEHGSANVDTSTLSEDVQNILWNPAQIIERIEAVFEARMLRVLLPRAQVVVPEDQFRRFEHFTVRFKNMVAHAGERIRAVFHSPDSGNAASIARVVQEEIRSIQSEIRDVVTTAAAKGNGPVLEAMQTAGGGLAETLSLADLDENRIFTVLADLPSDAKLDAGRFFSIEKKPEPKLTATFDVSNPPNLWDRMVLEKHEQETTALPFRWSWSDDELFCRNKTAQLRRCHRTGEQVMELWLETEHALFEGLAQWKQKCLQTIDPALQFITTDGRKMGLRQSLDEIVYVFRDYVTGQCREASNCSYAGVFWGQSLTQERKMLETELTKLVTFQGIPAPTFIRPAVELFYSRVTQSDTVSMEPLCAHHITQSKPYYFCPGKQVAGVSKGNVQTVIAAGFMYDRKIENRILAAVHSMLGTGDQHNKNNTIVREATSELLQLLSAIGSDIKETILFQSQKEYTCFWKGVLSDALRIIESFRHPGLSEELLISMKNAASFHIAWNCRDAALRIGATFDFPQDEAYFAEIHDFYPHPPEQEQAAQEVMGSSEAVSSKPLTKEELLDAWGEAVNRMAVRLCKRGFMIKQDNSVLRIDLEDVRKHGIEIIDQYCSSGPVGRKRVRSLGKELMAAVQRQDNIFGKQRNIRRNMQDVAAICMNEIQCMLLTNEERKDKPDTEIEPSGEARGATTLSSEFVQCIFISAVSERVAHLSTEEMRLYVEAGADRKVGEAFNKWQDRVMDVVDNALVNGASRLSLKQCLEILEILQRTTERRTKWSHLVPDFWRVLQQSHQVIRESTERRLREKCAMAEPPKNEGRTERFERIPREQLIGFQSVLRKKYYNQLDAQLVAVSNTMEQQTINRINDAAILGGEQLNDRAAQLPDFLTLEECRSYCEQIRHLPLFFEGVPNVPDEFRRFYEEVQLSIIAENERRLPELFHLVEQPGLRLPKEVLWSIALDYWEAAAPERFTQAEFVALSHDFKEAYRSCEQILRKLYEDLPPRITRDDCHVFIHAARTAMCSLEKMYPFPSSIQEAYKRSFDVIWLCAERSVDTLFDRQERQVAPRSPRIVRKDEENTQPGTSEKVSRDTLREWWNAVRTAAEKRLQISVQDSALHPTQIRKAVMENIPSLPHGNGLATAGAASIFVEEVKRRIGHMPRTIPIGGATLIMPEELREFLLEQLAQLEQGFLSLGLQVRGAPGGEGLTGVTMDATTEAPVEPAPAISSEEWENMVREEIVAAGQKKGTSDDERQFAQQLSRKFHLSLKVFRMLSRTDPIHFPIRTRMELDAALGELRDSFSNSIKTNIFARISAELREVQQKLFNRAFNRIQGRAIRLLKDAGTPIGKQTPRRTAADTAPAPTGTAPEGDSAVTDSPEQDTREDHAERISDLLTVYDVPPEQAADRLSSAIADHVARAATEALAAQAQTMNREEFESAESELRKGIGLAAERAHALLSPVAPGTLTEEHLSAALHGAMEHATDGLNLSKAVLDSMREAMDESRSAIGTARTKEDLVEHVMEHGEGGRGKFEETARMHRNAREEHSRRQHAERVRQSHGQITTGLEQLTALAEELAAKAQGGGTDVERRHAAEDAEQLRTYIQLILGMYGNQAGNPDTHVE